MTETNLLSSLTPTTLDDEELLSVIQARYMTGKYDTPNAIVYGGGALVARFADGRLVAVEPGPLFDQTVFDDFAESVRGLKDGVDDIVQCTVAFSNVPVRGYYASSAADVVLGPVPPSAPLPNVLLADHPFLLWYRVTPNDDFSVTHSRSRKAAERWALVLNALIVDGVRRLPRYSSHHWVLCGDSAGPIEERITWAQEFYATDIPSYDPPGFPRPLEPMVPIRESGTYYGTLGIGVGDVFDVPDSLDALINAFIALPANLSARYLRGCQWFTTARDVAGVSSASMVVALVAAIESLAADDLPTRSCECCGRPMEAPTRRFKDFLEAHALGAGNRTANDRLYGLRSKLVHGVATLLADDSSVWSFSPDRLDERDDLDRLYRAVRFSLVNWLRQRAGLGLLGSG